MTEYDYVCISSIHICSASDALLNSVFMLYCIIQIYVYFRVVHGYTEPGRVYPNTV